jgi:hypothetical protein
MILLKRGIFLFLHLYCPFIIVCKSRYIQFVNEAEISDLLLWKYHLWKKLLCSTTVAIVHDLDLSSLRKMQMWNNVCPEKELCLE